MLKEELLGLSKLQKMEFQFEELEQVLKDHVEDKDISKLQKEINKIEAALENKNKRIELLKKELRRMELKLQELYETVKNMEERIYSGEVTTVKELELLKRKQEDARNKIDELEEKAIIAMDELENLKSIIPKENKMAAEKKKEYDEKRLKSRQEIDKINNELSMIVEQKNQLEKCISPELLKKYYKIKRFKRDPVAEVSDGKCKGCMMEASVMIALDVKRYEHLIYCENCGRILV